MSTLSIQLGFTSCAIRQIKFKPFPKAQAGVARFLGLQPQDIWPSRYDATGRPLRKTRSDLGKAKPRLRAEEPQKIGAI